MRIFTIIILASTVLAQTPSKSYSLNPEAAQEYIKLEDQRLRIIEAYKQVEYSQRLLLMGSIPPAARSNCVVAKDSVTCTIPETPKP